MIPSWAAALGAAVAGLLGAWLLVRWFSGQMQAKEQADLSNAGLQAEHDGEIEAGIVEAEAEQAANEARKRANEGW